MRITSFVGPTDWYNSSSIQLFMVICVHVLILIYVNFSTTIDFTKIFYSSQLYPLFLCFFNFHLPMIVTFESLSLQNLYTVPEILSLWKHALTTSQITYELFLHPAL